AGVYAATASRPATSIVTSRCIKSLPGWCCVMGVGPSSERWDSAETPDQPSERASHIKNDTAHPSDTQVGDEPDKWCDSASARDLGLFFLISAGGPPGARLRGRGLTGGGRVACCMWPRPMYRLRPNHPRCADIVTARLQCTAVPATTRAERVGAHRGAVGAALRGDPVRGAPRIDQVRAARGRGAVFRACDGAQCGEAIRPDVALLDGGECALVDAARAREPRGCRFAVGQLVGNCGCFRLRACELGRRRGATTAPCGEGERECCSDEGGCSARAGCGCVREQEESAGHGLHPFPGEGQRVHREQPCREREPWQHDGPRRSCADVLEEGTSAAYRGDGRQQYAEARERQDQRRPGLAEDTGEIVERQLLLVVVLEERSRRCNSQQPLPPAELLAGYEDAECSDERVERSAVPDRAAQRKDTGSCEQRNGPPLDKAVLLHQRLVDVRCLHAEQDHTRDPQGQKHVRRHREG